MSSYKSYCESVASIYHSISESQNLRISESQNRLEKDRKRKQ